MNFEQARFNMVEQQIRTWEVLDPDVLALLFEVRRELFVPAPHAALAAFLVAAAAIALARYRETLD